MNILYMSRQHNALLSIERKRQIPNPPFLDSIPHPSALKFKLGTLICLAIPSNDT